VGEEDLLKNRHNLDCSAALGIDNLAAVIANLLGMFQAVLSYRLTGCKLPGSLEKTPSLKRGTLTAQDKHLLPCAEAAAGAEPPPTSLSHDGRRRKRTAPYRMGYTQPSCHSEPWVTLGDTATCIREEGLNPPCLWFL